ncbi:MAG: hypothetical protein ABSA46_07755 [Thermodesulfovibrionales bacterium]|jgi:hypothetical protein
MTKKGAGRGAIAQEETRDQCSGDFMSYHMDIKDNSLVLKTTSFKTEMGSFLHSNIFNRELAVSLLAGALLIVFGFFFAVPGKITAFHLVSAVVAFGTLFLLLRIYVFPEPAFEAVFDRSRGVIETSLRKATGRKRDRYLMSELSVVRLDHRIVQPQNLDGIKVVKKIALQHGMVLPGFGETADIYTVQLDFPGRSVTLFSTTDKPEAKALVAKLSDFLQSAGNCRER